MTLQPTRMCKISREDPRESGSNIKIMEACVEFCKHPDGIYYLRQAWATRTLVAR
jgi:hypothetical protein